jgi:prevent-host-death family protein
MMRRISVKQARADFEKLTEEMRRSKDRLLIEKDGFPIAVLLSIDDFEDLMETVGELSDSEYSASIREARAEYRRGEVDTEMRIVGKTRPLATELETKHTEHPYIIYVPGIASGEPIIKGTRVPVRAIVLHYKASETLEEILEAYPHVPPAAVFDAISYYLDHQEEIEALIEENRPERVMEKHGLKVGAKGQLFPATS